MFIKCNISVALCVCALSLFVSTGAATAETFVLPENPDDSVVGEIQYIRARKEDTLLDIARRYGLGHDEIVGANPTVSRWVPGEGTLILIPSRYILPDAPREGIVLNVAELRLYYYPPAAKGEEKRVMTFPVSVGRVDWKTPIGDTRVVRKDKNPPWRPTASIKREHAAMGEPLPDVIPGGSPENPLGGYALRLAIPAYLIHGVDARKEAGIGMQVTHGCVRMYPEDVELLYGIVKVGTKVRIQNAPLKAGWKNDQLFLEVHSSLEDEGLVDHLTLETATEFVHRYKRPGAMLDQKALARAVHVGSGVPNLVAYVPVEEKLSPFTYE